MALDGDIITKTLTFGTAKVIEDAGTGMTLSATLTANLPTVGNSGKTTRRLTWGPSGNQYHSIPTRKDVGADEVGQFTSVPVCDQPGWKLDGADADVTGGKVAFTYSLKITAGAGASKSEYTFGPFVISKDDADTIDVDELIATTTSSGTTISVVDKWTSLVAAAEAAASAAAISTALPVPGAYSYNGDGTVHAGPSGEVYAYNPDGTIHTVTLDGVTRTFSYNGDGTVAGVA